MVQVESAGIAAIIVVHRRGQGVQDNIQVLLCGFYRYGVGLLLLILKLVLGFRDGSVLVGAALVVEGLLDQLLRVGVRTDGEGLDILLDAVQVLDDRFRGNFQSKRAERTHEYQNQRDAGCYQFFQCFFLHSLEFALDTPGHTAVRVTLRVYISITSFK